MYCIDYIEFWAVKHCNLNCKGCSSASPLAEEWFLDVKMLKKDLSRLNDMGISFKSINVLGGEPLLHPELPRIFDIIKRVFPKVSIGLLTNGLLLRQMQESFWESCQKNSVKLNVTCFPVMSKDVRKELEMLIKTKGLNYHMTDKKRFNKILVQNNKSSLEDIIKSCGCKNAYNLYDGEISRCTVPMVAPILNKAFNAGFIEKGRINIYESNAEDIVRFLSEPNESCFNCSAAPIKVDWERVKDEPRLTDWLVH